MSQTDAAARAGIDRATWSRVELGQFDPRLDTLLRIQYALGVDSIEGLFGPLTGDLFDDEAAARPAPGV